MEVAPAMQMTPTQKKALDEIVRHAKSRSASLVELRSPPELSRGHGVTMVLQHAAAECGVPLLSVATTLAVTDSDDEGACARLLHAAAMKSLEDHGMVFIDDLDLAAAPRSLRRSRTLVGAIKGSGDMYNWNVAPRPAMILKALGDAASAAGRVVVFSSIEDSHLAFMQSPLTVTMAEPTQNDYTAVLKAQCGAAAAELDVSALYTLHSQLAPADLVTAVGRAALAVSSNPKVENAKVDTEALLASVRGDLVSNSAVSPEDVEAVDLATYPGMEGIKDELEKQVLFPLEHPEMASELGLAPKRGVIIHGDPGTGKTTVGRWLAHRLKGKFFLVREMMVHADIIKVFAAAKAAAPAVVFIDDADIVVGGWRPIDGGRGSDIFRFLLSHMDGLTSRGEKQKGDVVVMLTGQNVKWMAGMLLRSGRIELWLKTKLPGPQQKREILKKYIKEDEGALELLGKDGVVPDVRPAAVASDQYNCADLRRIVSDAKILAAWAKKKAAAESKEVKSGAEYLEEAALALRDMKNEVEEAMRKMYC